MLEAFKLRGKATISATRAARRKTAAGSITYEKCFPGLKLMRVIEFTGNGLPEENRMVALKTLSFREMPRERERLFRPALSPSATSPRCC